MFYRIWQWLTGSYVHNAINGFEKATANLVKAVETEAKQAEAQVQKKFAAVETTNDIQKALREDYERMIAREAERHASNIDKIDTVLIQKNEAVAKGSAILAQINTPTINSATADPAVTKEITVNVNG